MGANVRILAQEPIGGENDGTLDSSGSGNDLIRRVIVKRPGKLGRLPRNFRRQFH